jgi:fibro-slime domain-containing protein
MAQFGRFTYFRSFSYLVLVIGCANGGSNSGLPTTSASGGTTNGGSTEAPVIPVILTNCGDGKPNDGEFCDDGNTVNTDGCNRLCQIAADYRCPEWGKPCVNQTVCGDKFLSSAEACDDGNTANGDGCSADCRSVEAGWRCSRGKPCTTICGDGIIVLNREDCDDGNKINDDGCSSRCQKEPGYSCTGTPSNCTPSKCGNAEVEDGEACDLGDALNGLFHGDGSGCSSTCTNEPTCRDEAGTTQACVTRCGDGNIDTYRGEACDDGNGRSGDGCSAECKIELGFECTNYDKKDAQPCRKSAGTECLQLPITYRDFDGSNQASGHPDFLYYGSIPVGGKKIYCVPNASGRSQGTSGSCPGNDSTELCLGLTNPQLDGKGKPVANTNRAGGLTCACQFTDWDKTPISTELNAMATLPAGITTSKCSSGGSGEISVIKQTNAPVIQSEKTFSQWYNDSEFSTKSVEVLELSPVTGTSNNYRFTASDGRTLYDDIHDIWLAKNSQPVPTGAKSTLESGFFPLESVKGTHAIKMCNLWHYWTAPSNCIKDQWDVRGGSGSPPPGATAASVPGVERNFYFTTEVRYLFRFVGGETLTFHGDDDVWVYVNGVLVLDMGAPHERLEGTVTLSATGTNAILRSQDVITQEFSSVGKPQSTPLSLDVGRTYEIAIFHADHHPRDSNYQLTLTGFSRNYSKCGPVCGDGVVSGGEECDLGKDLNTGVYDGCNPDCTFAPYCGDGQTDSPNEDCDKARENVGTYGLDGCTPACNRAHFCGDGNVDLANGEQCDAGRTPSTQCNKECIVEIL